MCEQVVQVCRAKSKVYSRGTTAKNGSGYIIKKGGPLMHIKAIYYRSLNGRDDEE